MQGCDIQYKNSLLSRRNETFQVDSFLFFFFFFLKKTKTSESLSLSDIKLVQWGVFKGTEEDDRYCLYQHHVGVCIYLGKNADFCFYSCTTQNPYFNSYTPVSRMQHVKAPLVGNRRVKRTEIQTQLCAIK